VGKSSLFNCLIRERIAIVEPTPGITRDRLYGEVRRRGTRFTLADTGGIGIVDRDDLAEEVERQVHEAIADADLLVFLVDIREGPVALDDRVASILRTTGKPVILAANKADHPGADASAVEFFRLGFGEPLPVSAEQRRNISDLVEAVEAILPEAVGEEAEPGRAVKVCIVGRRNAGKSTLTNALAGGDRVIVSETPGTTRDSVDVNVTREGERLVLVDTAGIRRRSRIQNSVEFYSQARAEKAIRRSDVALLLLDATVEIGVVDKKIADYVTRHYKACVVAVNKWDLVPAELTPAKFLPYIHERLRGLAWAPVSFLSAETGLNVEETFALARELVVQMDTRVSTAEVNRVVREAFERRKPPPREGRLPKIYFATQVSVRPPTIVLFVNRPRWFGHDYLRYLENRFREELPFAEVPVRMVLRQRGAQRK